MHKLNLLPMEVLINQSKRKRRLLFILIMSILIVLLIFSMIYINNSKICLEREIHNASQDITDLKARMHSRNNYEQILKDYHKRQDILKDLMKNKINYSQTINQVILLMPEEVTVISLRIDASDNLILEGYAPSHDYVARIIEEIQTIDCVIDVSLGFMRYVEAKDRNDPSYHFEIVIGLKKDR